MGPIMVQNDPKCSFSLFFGIIFGVFAKAFFKTAQSFTMGHCLKFPPKKNFFCRTGLPGGPETAQTIEIAFLSRFTPICQDIFHKLPLNGCFFYF